jgi:MoxR-like ATPase
MKFLEESTDLVVALPAVGRLPATAHVWNLDAREAVNSALAAGRPLLLRGEPGTGKSQLARAATVGLGRAYLSYTVDARTEARDLLYTVDTVARLAEAQILGHRKAPDAVDVRAELAEENFTTPGPLWWVFDWRSAEDQVVRAHQSTVVRPWTPADWRIEEGTVLLIDEIDKADPAVPNGLLEALGAGVFSAPGREPVVALSSVAAPLVVITTNEERALPDAFVRRCMVLQLGWPKDRESFVKALIERGSAHFPSLEEDELREAAEMVAADRAVVLDRGLGPPGGAEYLDLLRAVFVRWPEDSRRRRQALRTVRRFALDKHAAELGL